jgi:hypothetical protein
MLVIAEFGIYAIEISAALNLVYGKYTGNLSPEIMTRSLSERQIDNIYLQVKVGGINKTV